MQQQPDYAIQRLRHPLKFRYLEVKRSVRLSPHLVRITLVGEDLADFISASFDDHLKVFLPAQGESRPNLPVMGEQGLLYPEGLSRPITRDYTPRRFDAQNGELDLEFVLHEAGPASEWAAQAQAGDVIGIAGPRGSLVIPKHYDWHYLIGDETALPAIARRLEELPATCQTHVMIYLNHETARIPLASPSQLHLQWLIANQVQSQAEQIAAALELWQLPKGSGYAWVAGEWAMAAAVRKHLVEVKGLSKTQIRAASYWRQGEIATHSVLED